MTVGANSPRIGACGFGQHGLRPVQGNDGSIGITLLNQCCCCPRATAESKDAICLQSDQIESFDQSFSAFPTQEIIAVEVSRDAIIVPAQLLLI